MSSPYSDNSSLYQRAKQLIPGGTQLLSKRPEMYAPEVWPAYYRSATGCRITDIEGRQYIDMSNNGVGACLLGYADPDVNEAVIERVRHGTACSLNSPDEVELAELMLELHPWAQQARFARTGGEAMVIAVRLARAATGRDRVAVCGYHGWHDWYLAANHAEEDPLADHLLEGLSPTGVPRSLAGTCLPFHYNCLEELRAISHRCRGSLAAVVMEPTRHTAPAPGFLEGVRELCETTGAALIFDEISMGFRLHHGGAHMRWGIAPDMAVFAKAIANGHAMGAVIGRADFMQAAQRSFVSSTSWTEGVGPAAALATIKKLGRLEVPQHVERIGMLAREGWLAAGDQTGLPVTTSGFPAMLHWGFNHPARDALGTLFTVRMLARGFLCSAGFYPTLAHTPETIQLFLQHATEVLAECKRLSDHDDLAQVLETPVRHRGFQRLN